MRINRHLSWRGVSRPFIKSASPETAIVRDLHFIKEKEAVLDYFKCTIFFVCRIKILFRMYVSWISFCFAMRADYYFPFNFCFDLSNEINLEYTKY